MLKLTPKIKILSTTILSCSFLFSTIASQADSQTLSGFSLTDYNPFFTSGETELSDTYYSTITQPHLLGAVFNDENNALLEEQAAKAIEEANSKTQECQNSEGGLGKQQQKDIESEQGINASTLDIDKIYEVGKSNGCFDVLNDFPDLSVNIPSLSAIFDAVTSTLLKYAQRKVCTAVNSAIEEALEPGIKALDKISDQGKIDLTGAVDDEINKGINKIDPDIGKITSQSSSEKDVW